MFNLHVSNVNEREAMDKGKKGEEPSKNQKGVSCTANFTRFAASFRDNQTDTGKIVSEANVPDVVDQRV
jgi:hypothetical protein